MDVLYVDNEGEVLQESVHDRVGILRKLHEIGSTHLNFSQRSSRILTTDMDGVLIVDDNALDLCRMIAGDEGVRYFGQVAGENIKAVEKGEMSYCWNAPCVFVGSLLNGLPTQINSIVGEHMRFVPGARANIEHLLSLGFDITNVTAGHQEGAQEVSRRLGIEKTIATQFGVKNGLYTGEVLRFIGGEHKLHAVRDLLYNNGSWEGSHVGDSHSDLETMREHPSSIAWNPAHDLAVSQATINVFGTDKRGLTPLYDIDGKLDASIELSHLPLKVVVHESPDSVGTNNDLLREQISWGKTMRAHYGQQIEAQTPYDVMVSRVHRQIQDEVGLSTEDFKRHIGRVNGSVFLPLSKFQQNALRAYKRLS